MKRLAICLALALTSCAGLNLTPKQSMFAAYSTYDAALTGAVAYADSPTANPAIVHSMNTVNQSEPVKAAVRFGKAYTACLGSNQTVTPIADCSKWDFSNKTASGYASVLRGAVVALLKR